MRKKGVTITDGKLSDTRPLHHFRITGTSAKGHPCGGVLRRETKTAKVSKLWGHHRQEVKGRGTRKKGKGGQRITCLCAARSSTEVCDLSNKQKSSSAARQSQEERERKKRRDIRGT